MTSRFSRDANTARHRHDLACGLRTGRPPDPRPALAVPACRQYIPSMLTAEPLKLLAFDEDDLAVMSTHLQDAQVRPAEIAWLPAEHRFALVVDRFDWCAADCGERRRRRTGLHFERVLAVRRSQFQQEGDTVSSLVAVAFAPGEAPAGSIILSFADGAAIRLDVECLEAAMADLDTGRPCADAPVAALER
ncbi:DUF2948 family protein [Labrys wisconsinensis]|nr:DUF2948 family protein [Labrys wisconsinensis]